MRVASYNVENMFRRAKALNQETWEEGKEVLEAYAALSELLEKPVYSDEDCERILELLAVLGLQKSDDGEFAVLRRPRGQLISRHRNGSVEVIAKGRGDWIGWLDLKKEAVDEVATRNTAAVIADIGADVLGVVEAEDRPALLRFNEDVLKLASANSDGGYPHVMLIDGNDERGIDVGLLAKDGFSIDSMRSHVDDRAAGDERIFSRDCPEYQVETPDGGSFLVMVNHFKSKGYGKQVDSNARRRQQAERVAQLYEERLAEGNERIVVLGDLNDTPDSDPLAPLVQGTTLKDAGQHASFAWGERKGTYGGGNDQIDYLLLSPVLFDTIEGGGVNRKGVWHGTRTKDPWEMLPTLTREVEAASDHAAVWVDLAI
jgi:endonuclease/exonuclease/phosphatase family metal-dependent hydrolase